VAFLSLSVLPFGVAGLDLIGAPGSDVLGGQFGAETEQLGTGGGVQAAADPAAHQQAFGTVQPGD